MNLFLYMLTEQVSSCDSCESKTNLSKQNPCKPFCCNASFSFFIALSDSWGGETPDDISTRFEFCLSFLFFKSNQPYPFIHPHWTYFPAIMLDFLMLYASSGVFIFLSLYRALNYNGCLKGSPVMGRGGRLLPAP